MRFRTDRALRILIGRQPTRRWYVVALYLIVSVVAREVALAAASLVPVLAIANFAADIWHTFGVRYDTFTGPTPGSIRYVDVGATPTDYWVILAGYVSPYLLNIALAWIAHMFIAPRPLRRTATFARLYYQCALVLILLLPVARFVALCAPYNAFTTDHVLLLSEVGLVFGPALVALADFTRRGRRIAGLCVHCRYWLRGVVGDRCPECGTPIRKGRVDSVAPGEPSRGKS